MPTVRELYERHMADIGDKCISVFGYPGYQVLEAVEFWERRSGHVSSLLERQKEIVMARHLTKEERIAFYIYENRIANKSSLEQSRGYCTALVEGEMKIEEWTAKQKEINQMHEMTREQAKFKLLEQTKNHCTEKEMESFLDMAEALGLIKFKEPDLSPVMKAICSVMIETEVRQGPDYGKLTPGYPSQYGAGCLIDGLMNKGYQITKV